MQLKDLTISTINPEIFSGGASPTDYIRLWGQTLSLISKANDDATVVDLDWEQNVKGVRFRQGVSFGTAAVSAPLDQHDIYVRALCHVMVNAIPQQGLAALTESISNLFEFFVTEMPQVVASQLPSKGRITHARVVRRAERDPLELPEG